MKLRRTILLVLGLLLIPVGMVVAQSSTNFVVQRFTVYSGGSASSAQYRVRSVIGQPAAGIVSSSRYRVSAGFLYPQEAVFDVWLPMIRR